MSEGSFVVKWTAQQKKMLALEHESEKMQLADKILSLTAKDCEVAGLSLLSMSIESVTTALFGRSCLSLIRSNSKEVLKSFKVGDEVVIYCPKLRHTAEFTEVECVVSKLLPTSIQLICDNIDESIFDNSVRVDARATDSTYRKYLNALHSLESSVLPLTTLLFSEKEFQSISLGVVRDTRELNPKKMEFINPSLNKSQAKAVISALEMKQITVIHGPPGTGKTSTVVELILQSAALHRRILVCAPSNVAVDNILERLIIAKGSSSSDKEKFSRNPLKFVRLGHPARLSPRGADYCLDSLVATDDGTEIVSDVRTDIDRLRKDLLSCKKKDGNKRREMQSELRVLFKEARKREDAVVKNILRSADVVLCTCVTAGSHLLKEINFDIVIIDEAAQALEVSCWIPLLMSSKCVLVGDHNQLPPTVKSAVAVSMGLGKTLFERVIMNSVFQDAGLIHLLDTQYRMNSSICDWSSTNMYEGRLQSHSSVANRTVGDILEKKAPNIGEEMHRRVKVNLAISSEVGARASIDSQIDLPFYGPEILPVLLLLDTTGCEMHESACKEGSRSNYAEAVIVLQHVLYLFDMVRVQPEGVGVITPYNGQLSILKELFASRGEDDPRLLKVDIKTIDGYQGGEKECVIISMVRSNMKSEIGFLGDKRRINVAVTRAKVHLAIVCDADVCASDPFIKTLLDHISSVGVHVGIMEVSYLTPCLSQDASCAGPSLVKQLLLGVKVHTTDDSRLLKKLKGKSSLKAQRLPVGEPKFESHQLSKAASASGFKSPPFNMQSEIERIVRDLIANTMIMEEGITEAIRNIEGEGEFRSGIAVLKIQPITLKAAENVPIKNSFAVATFIRFSVSLDSYCRRLVHEVATRSSLFHRSVGISPDRYIEVSLVPFPTDEVTATELSIPGECALETVKENLESDLPLSFNSHVMVEEPELDSNIEGTETCSAVRPDSDVDEIRKLRAEKFRESKSLKQPLLQKKAPMMKCNEMVKDVVDRSEDDASYLERIIMENQVMLI